MRVIDAEFIEDDEPTREARPTRDARARDYTQERVTVNIAPTLRVQVGDRKLPISRVGRIVARLGAQLGKLVTVDDGGNRPGKRFEP